MPKLSNMLGETGRLEIPVSDDDPLVVHYRRGVLTPRMQIRMVTAQRQMQGAGGEAAADPESLMFMCEMFSSLIASWNLTSDDGSPIGTDPESLADVDLSILTLVMQAIGKEMSPDPLSGRDSSNGLHQTASSEPLRIGTA